MHVGVTRPGIAGEALVFELVQKGIDALHMPLITFAAGRQLDQLAQHLAHLKHYDWVIALSPRAVAYAQQILTSAQWPSQVHYFAVGAATSAALKESCGRAVRYPLGRSSSEALLSLLKDFSIAERQVLLLRGNGGRMLLVDSLVKRGAKVITCECYQRISLVRYPLQQVAEWQRHGVDCMVITSGEILQHLYLSASVRQREWLFQCHLVVVSHRLQRLARQLGWTKIAVADNADNDALLRSVQSIG